MTSTLQWVVVLYSLGALVTTLVTAWTVERSLERTRDDPEMAPLWALAPAARGRFLVVLVLFVALTWPVSLVPIVRHAIHPDVDD